MSFTGHISKQQRDDSESFHPWSDTYHEQWVWSSEDKSPSVYLCLNDKVACFYIDPVIESTGTAGVRGTKAFTHGQHYWEVKLSSVFGTSIMIGVGTKEALLQTADFEFVDLIGRDEQSWGLSYKARSGTMARLGVTATLFMIQQSLVYSLIWMQELFHTSRMEDL